MHVKISTVALKNRNVKFSKLVEGGEMSLENQISPKEEKVGET